MYTLVGGVGGRDGGLGGVHIYVGGYSEEDRRGATPGG